METRALSAGRRRALHAGQLRGELLPRGGDGEPAAPVTARVFTRRLFQEVPLARAGFAELRLDTAQCDQRVATSLAGGEVLANLFRLGTRRGLEGGREGSARAHSQLDLLRRVLDQEGRQPLQGLVVAALIVVVGSFRRRPISRKVRSCDRRSSTTSRSVGGSWPMPA